MEQSPSRILITGANGNLGCLLLGQMGRAKSGEHQNLRALVRSERAASAVRSLRAEQPVEIEVGDYGSYDSIRRAVTGCDVVVHLVGIIKENQDNTYTGAHEHTCTILERAAYDAGIQNVVYLSIIGSDPDSTNACLASKGKAEQILLQGRVPATILRVPMVLGPGDRASASLRAQAQARLLPLIGGGGSLQQPIDAQDVVRAIVSSLSRTDSQALDLGGPERLHHRALTTKAGALYGRKPIVIPIPIFFARWIVAGLERFLRQPPITTDMLEILQHNDRVDELPACRALGLTLTPLEDTLRAYVGPESIPHD